MKYLIGILFYLTPFLALAQYEFDTIAVNAANRIHVNGLWLEDRGRIDSIYWHREYAFAEGRIKSIEESGSRGTSLTSYHYNSDGKLIKQQRLSKYSEGDSSVEAYGYNYYSGFGVRLAYHNNALVSTTIIDSLGNRLVELTTGNLYVGAYKGATNIFSWEAQFVQDSGSARRLANSFASVSDIDGNGLLKSQQTYLGGNLIGTMHLITDSMHRPLIAIDDKGNQVYSYQYMGDTTVVITTADTLKNIYRKDLLGIEYSTFSCRQKAFIEYAYWDAGGKLLRKTEFLPLRMDISGNTIKKESTLTYDKTGRLIEREEVYTSPRVHGSQTYRYSY